MGLAALVFAALFAGREGAWAQATTPAQDYAGYKWRTGSNPFGPRTADAVASRVAYRANYRQQRYSNTDIQSRNFEGRRNSWRQGEYGSQSGSPLGNTEYVPTCFYRTKEKTIAYNFKPVIRAYNRYDRYDLPIDKGVGPIPKYRLSQPAISVNSLGAKERIEVKQRNITASGAIDRRD
jgi:hypothetical protein